MDHLTYIECVQSLVQFTIRDARGKSSQHFQCVQVDSKVEDCLRAAAIWKSEQVLAAEVIVRVWEERDAHDIT